MIRTSMKIQVAMLPNTVMNKIDKYKVWSSWQYRWEEGWWGQVWFFWTALTNPTTLTALTYQRLIKIRMTPFTLVTWSCC